MHCLNCRAPSPYRKGEDEATGYRSEDNVGALIIRIRCWDALGIMLASIPIIYGTLGNNMSAIIEASTLQVLVLQNRSSS